MNLRIRRRRFGQLVVATAASTAIANFASKSIAQTSPSTIYGLTLSANKAPLAVGNAITAIGSGIDITNVANNTPGVVLVSSDVNTGNQISTLQVAATTVDNQNTPIEAANKAISREPSERLTALSALSNGTFVAVSVVNSNKGDVSRLILINPKSATPIARKISGFKKSNSTVESLLAARDDTLIAVVSQNGGIPPFELVTIDLKSGKVNYNNGLGLPDLLPNIRLSNLAQSSDGTFYATFLEAQGGTSLVQIDLKNKSLITGKGRIINQQRLTLNGKPLANDLKSLVFSSSDQLFALADATYEGTNSL